jgi:hypothetical protein
MFTHVYENAKTPAEIEQITATVLEAIKTGEIKLEDISLRDVAEATLGAEGIRKLANANNESSFVSVQESVAPVNLSAFTNITGQMVYQGVYQAYSAPEFIGEQLVTTETSREDNTRIPGLAEINEDAIEVEEGGEYPDVKFGEDWIDVPQSKKRGLKIGITREMVFFDRTGQVMDMSRSVGETLGLNKERRIIDLVIGATNTYKRKGVTRNTYVSAVDDPTDPRINEITEALTDWTSIDKVMQTFEAMSNDATGDAKRPIMVTPRVILCTAAKIATVRSILNSTEISTSTNTAGTQTIHSNPVAGMVQPVTSPWLKRRLVAAGVVSATADTYWYMGDPKRAFRYRTLFPLQVLSAQHDKDAFERDVVAQFRADERGVAYVYAPWYVVNAHE